MWVQRESLPIVNEPLNRELGKQPTIHGLSRDEVATRHGVDARVWPIGDGWAELVDRLLTDLEALGWRQVRSTRLEEKYGELLFEVASDTEWNSVIANASPRRRVSPIALAPRVANSGRRS